MPQNKPKSQSKLQWEHPKQISEGSDKKIINRKRADKES